MRPNGQRKVSAGSILLGDGEGAEFIVKGPKHASISISFGSNSTLQGSGQSMGFGEFSVQPNTVLTLGGNGTRKFKVGGSLKINSHQKGGAYTGTYLVTIDLN